MASLVPEDEILIDDAVPEDILDELDDRRREALALLAAKGDGWEPATSEDLPVLGGCAGLELLSLAEERPGSGWKLTPTGQRAAEMVRAS